MPLPDGPRDLPLLQLMRAIVQPLKSLDDVSRKYGRVYTAHFSGFQPIVVVAEPAGVEAIMTADPSQFEAGRGNKILAPLLGDASIVLLDGVPHQRQRRLLTPPFHGERMRSYGQWIYDIACQATDRWQPGQPFAARSVTQEISLRVILRAVFGLNQTGRAEQLRQQLNEYLEFFNIPLSATFLFMPALQQNWGPWGTLLRQQQQIDELIYAEIRDLQQHPERNGEDILSLMLAARDEAGEPMAEQELRDELMTLLFAGHETTATALAWALYWIHRLPQVKEKLLQELASLGDNPDLNTIVRLPYLNAVCQETLRLYPVALFAFSRIFKTPVQFLDYKFEPGTQLSPCIYLLHRHPDLYPEPEQFRPERFLERQFSPYEYLPFGGGNRRCIGTAFAQFEMKIVLAAILSRWELALPNDRPVQPIRRGVTLAPAKGVSMRVVGRRAAPAPPANSR